MLKYFLICVALAVAAPPLRAESAPSEVDAPRFEAEVGLFAIEDEIFPPNACATLFVGSSSIRFWFTLARDFPSLKIIRRGFGGSKIADVLYYFDRIVTPYHPRAIVFYAGENDIHDGMTPEDVFASFKKFMQKKDLELGETPVYFISIKPSIARIADLPAQTVANGKIAEFAATRSDLVFIDVASAMMDGEAPKNIFIADDLHMNADGYSIWRAIVGDALAGKTPAAQAPYCS